MLSLVLPKGSLERATLELFDAADLTVRRSSDRDYHASIDDPRIERVRFLRPPCRKGSGSAPSSRP